MKPYCYGRNIGIQRVGVKKNANDLLYALRSVLFAISPRAPCTVYLAPFIYAIPPHPHPEVCSPVEPSGRRIRLCPRPGRT